MHHEMKDMTKRTQDFLCVQSVSVSSEGLFQEMRLEVRRRIPVMLSLSFASLVTRALSQMIKSRYDPSHLEFVLQTKVQNVKDTSANNWLHL